MWRSIFENLFTMILTIVILLGGSYLLLMILGWGLKLKSKGREQAGLTDLWIESQRQASARNETDKKAESRE